ncbi:hypothetical protein FOZ62_018706 [Perkinsus olseni]|uniref:EGF domain-specific O-linked N-acetylglucosamine transferase n=1 Tax=Perkinsus olseni TaxID=32597 RepID=A0A7J6T4X7_PEROL|nr:hypothetical protein FOZ62_018706 [Perkinsus olseni]
MKKRRRAKLFPWTRVNLRYRCVLASVLALGMWMMYTLRDAPIGLGSEGGAEVGQRASVSLFERLIARYDDGGQPQDCGLLAGLSRVEKYRRAMLESFKVYCDGGGSELRCYDKTKGGVARNYVCEGRNLYTQTEEMQELTRLRFYGNCRASEAFREIKFIDCENKKNKQMAEFKDALGVQPNCSRTLGTVVVFRTRETLGRNPWHSHEEILTLFMTMAALELEPGGSTLLINRPKPDARKTFPLLGIYEALLAPGETVYADELAKAGGTVCFDRVIFPVPPEQAFHTKLPLEGCGRSPILMAYRQHLMEVYRIAATPPSGEPRITVISRGTGFNRRAVNEAEMVKSLERQGRRVQLVKFGKMKLQQQLEVAANTDVLVGVHGAALWWLVLLADCGRVLELGTGADGHYRNLATFRGISHTFIDQRVGHTTREFEWDLKRLDASVTDASSKWHECLLPFVVLWRFFRKWTTELFPSMAPRTKTNNGVLLWVDCEMTNLGDAYGVLGETDRLLEVALIVTDKDLNVLHEGPDLVIHQPNEVLNGMNNWCRKQFGWENGQPVPGLLADEVVKSTISEGEADRQLAEVAAKFVSEGQGLLAGNTVHVDKRFLEKYMPRFSGYLHYRVLDVSTLKELAKRWDPKALEAFTGKRATHRALEDIQDSINELKHYRDCGFINCKGSH